MTGLDPDAVLPTIGSKELVALLPLLLRVGPGDRVLLPEVAYPTYEVGVRLAGAEPVRSDGLVAAGPGAGSGWSGSTRRRTRPAGCCPPPTCARWSTGPASAVRSWSATSATWTSAGRPSRSRCCTRRSCGVDLTGLLAVHSLSKRSNLAGYRAGFVAGDPRLVAGLLEVRKHAGLIVPAPVQAAAAAAYGDDGHVAEQRGRYAARRAVLRPALEAAGFAVEHSEAGLYLWATRGEDCWASVDRLAALGILVAPGSFYGPAGQRHVRVALTATDERVAAAASRLSHPRPRLSTPARD